MDLTDEPLICSSCVDFLKEQFIFILDFMELQKKIKIYQDLHGNTITSTVDLCSVLQFSQNLKTEDDIEIGDIKLEDTNFSLIQDINLKVETKSEVSSDLEDISYEMELKEEITSENEDNCRKEHEMTATNQGKVEENHMVHQINWSGCSSTPKSTSSSYSYNSRHYSKSYHSIPEKCNSPQMHSCTKCSYETRSKHNLILHIRYKHKKNTELETHNYLNYCNEDSRHVHCEYMKTTEPQMHKCSNCSYEAKQKCSLIQHIQNKHMNLSELKMYKCSNCTYVAKQKNCLLQHIKYTHMDPSKLQMYKCSNCSYESKHKSALVRHIQNKHKDPSELQMHKCSDCSYEAKERGALVKHIKCKHVKPGELQMYKCSNCSYEAKQKISLVRHIQNKHMDPSKLPIYKCPNCSYVAKQKSNLVRHIQYKHMDPSKLQIYHCPSCFYKTKQKSNLVQHIKNNHTEQ